MLLVVIVEHNQWFETSSLCILEGVVESVQSDGFQAEQANTCLYHSWTQHGLGIWISWVDDCLACGTKEGVKIAKAQLLQQFDCDEIGNMNKNVGCKIDRNFDDRTMKFTQPVMLQSFHNEFDLQCK